MLGAVLLLAVLACSTGERSVGDASELRTVVTESDVPTVGLRDSGLTVEGCDDLAVGERLHFVATWPQVNACANTTYFFTPRAQDLRVALRWPAAEVLADVGVPQTYALAAEPTLPSFRLDEGLNLFANTCEGWSYPGVSPQVSHTWDPVSGEVTVTVTSTESARRGTATVAWRSVEVARRDAPTMRCTVPDATFTDVVVHLDAMAGGVTP